MQSLFNIKIDKFPNLIRTYFVPSESQQMFIQSTNKMTYGHYVRFGAFWDAFLKWLENNQEVFEFLCKSDLPPEIIEVIMIKANMWFSKEIFETLQNKQCKIIEKFDAKQCNSIDELLKTSDFVSLHCPSTKETKGLINFDNLSKMQKNSAGPFPRSVFGTSGALEAAGASRRRRGR